MLLSDSIYEMTLPVFFLNFYLCKLFSFPPMQWDSRLLYSASQRREGKEGELNRVSAYLLGRTVKGKLEEKWKIITC